MNRPQNSQSNPRATIALVFLILMAAFVIVEKRGGKTGSVGVEERSVQESKLHEALPLAEEDPPVPSQVIVDHRDPFHESLWEAFEESRHRATEVSGRATTMERNRGVRFFGANPGQDLTARFLEDRTRIESGMKGRDWALELSLVTESGAAPLLH